MTVKQLIDELQTMDADAEVRLFSSAATYDDMLVHSVKKCRGLEQTKSCVVIDTYVYE